MRCTRENTIEVPKALVEEQIQQLQLDMARRVGMHGS